MHLFDEVEEHDDVAYNNSNEARYSKECHEPEGSTHDRQRDQCPNRSIRCGRKHEQGLDGILELHKQSQVDANERDQENDGKIRESIDLLRFLTCDLQLVPKEVAALIEEAALNAR